MNAILAQIRAALWLLIPFAVLVALIGWEIDWGNAVRLRPPPTEAITAKPLATGLLPGYAIAGGIGARTETVNRTLFNPTRRPAPVAVVDASKPRMQRGQFALTGTMVVGGKNTAFLREVAGGKPRRVVQGESINGMLVASVMADRVRFAVGDESEELILRVVTNPRTTVQPAAPAPAVAVASGAVNAAAATDSNPPPPSAAEASLAERRRAARAAQAATPPQAPAPAASPAPAAAGSAAAAATPPAAPGSAPDPRWGEVYRAYQQRGPLNPPK